MFVPVAPEPAPHAAPSTQPATIDRPSIAGRRIVKHFDFNEEPLGNFETLPMFWRRHGETGFPLFLEGRFDTAVGNASPPSFRLDLDGGSIGYHYQGRDISIHASSDYLVVAYVKTQSLETARAYITACYLDRKGIMIDGTEQRSELVGGSGGATEWLPIKVALPGNVSAARYVGVSLWLTQATVWQTSPRAMHHIERENVKGTAWFDDITVYRRPRVTLQSSHPGNTFREDERVELRTEISDPDGQNLTAKLVVRAEHGPVVEERSVEIRAGKSAHVERYFFDKLPVGPYEAELMVSTGDTVLVRRALRFLRLPEAVSPPQSTGRGFGVVLHSISPQLFAGQRELIQNLHVEHVKLPVWSARRALTQMETNHEDLDRYLEAIVAAGSDPVGMMYDEPPPEIGSAPDRVRSMLDLFSDDPRGWKPLIAGVWSGYAGLVHVWQVGVDDDEKTSSDPRLPGLVAVLRREMKPLMSNPLLASTSCVHEALNAPQASDYRCVTLAIGEHLAGNKPPPIIAPDDIAGHLQAVLGKDPRHVWALIKPLPEQQYPRELRVVDLARRLVEAHFQNVGGVFLDAPWDMREDALSSQIDPREDLITFRTVADVLGGSTPVSRTVIDGQAQCLVFDRNGRAILFVWDPLAPPEGREHILLLAENAKTVDLGGRTALIESIGKQQRIRIGPTPMFIINAPTWIIEFRRQFALDPPNVEASLDVYERHIVFRNTYRESISGLLRLVFPEDWDVRPNKIPFSLQPGEQFRQAVSVRFPLNAEAGITPLVGEFSVDADRRYQILAPAWFEFGLQNIDLDTYTYRAGDRVVVRQSMTNHTASPVSFDGYILAPERQRISRTFANFEPGQSVTKDFILENAADLTGKKIRIGLKEIQGTRVWNRIITVP